MKHVVAGSQMNGIHLNGKTRGSEKPVPGCLGRMVNLFDLSISGNRLLSDKPYNDGDSFTLTGFFFFWGTTYTQT